MKPKRADIFSVHLDGEMQLRLPNQLLTACESCRAGDEHTEPAHVMQHDRESSLTMTTTRPHMKQKEAKSESKAQHAVLLCIGLVGP